MKAGRYNFMPHHQCIVSMDCSVTPMTAWDGSSPQINRWSVLVASVNVLPTA